MVSVGGSEASAATNAYGTFVRVSPARILDTRTHWGNPTPSKVGQGQTLEFVVAGSGGVPAVGVDSVVLNVTATGGTGGGFLTVFPTGSPQPLASNLNFGSNHTVPNLVTVKVGAGGRVSIYNFCGSTDVIADVQGYYQSAAATTPASYYDAYLPTRVYDSRDDGPLGLFMGGVDYWFEIGAPPNATAVVMNVTVTQPQGAGWATIWPYGESKPGVSNLNFSTNQTIANAAVIPIAAGNGPISVSSSATTHMLFDVVGFMVSVPGTYSTVFRSMNPVRVFDTRTGIGSSVGPIGPTGARDFQVAGAFGIPPGAWHTSMNVTSTQSTESSWLSLWPTNHPTPGTSTLNWSAGSTVPNLACLTTNEFGRDTAYNAKGYTHVFADVGGYFIPPGSDVAAQRTGSVAPRPSHLHPAEPAVELSRGHS